MSVVHINGGVRIKLVSFRETLYINCLSYAGARREGFY